MCIHWMPRRGCVYWSYRTDAGVRNAMTVGPDPTGGKTHYAVYFGDLKANAYAIDAHDRRAASGRPMSRRTSPPA